MLLLIIENNLFSWPNGHSNKLFSNNQLKLGFYPLLNTFLAKKFKKIWDDFKMSMTSLS